MPSCTDALLCPPQYRDPHAKADSEVKAAVNEALDGVDEAISIFTADGDAHPAEASASTGDVAADVNEGAEFSVFSLHHASVGISFGSIAVFVVTVLVVVLCFRSRCCGLMGCCPKPNRSRWGKSRDPPAAAPAAPPAAPPAYAPSVFVPPGALSPWSMPAPPPSFPMVSMAPAAPAKRSRRSRSSRRSDGYASDSTCFSDQTAASYATSRRRHRSPPAAPPPASAGDRVAAWFSAAKQPAKRPSAPSATIEDIGDE